MKLDFDLHTHTYHSPCAHEEMIPAEMLHLAAQRGIRGMAITDHWYTFTDLAELEEVRLAVEEARKKTRGLPRVFFGCEAEIMSPGETAGSLELADRLDFVMVAATHFQNRGVTDLPPGDDESHARYFLEMFLYGVGLAWADVIAHPFFVVPGVCPTDVLTHIRDADLLPALELAKENHVAMEISRRIFTTPGQLPFSMHFYELCARVGVKFTCGSDAHQLKDLGQMYMLEPVISHLGLTKKDFWLPTRRSR